MWMWLCLSEGKPLPFGLPVRQSFSGRCFRKIYPHTKDLVWGFRRSGGNVGGKIGDFMLQKYYKIPGYILLM